MTCSNSVQIGQEIKICLFTPHLCSYDARIATKKFQIVYTQLDWNSSWGLNLFLTAILLEDRSPLPLQLAKINSATYAEDECNDLICFHNLHRQGSTYILSFPCRLSKFLTIAPQLVEFIVVIVHKTKHLSHNPIVTEIPN